MKLITIIIFIGFCYSQNISCVKQFEISQAGEDIFFRIRNIVQKDSAIYIMDKDGYCLYKFNKNGRFLSKTGRKGTGPGEFRDGIRSGVVYKNHIYINDSWVIHKFSEELDFIQFYKLNDTFVDIKTIKKGFVVQTRDFEKDEYVIVCDEHFKKRGSLKFINLNENPVLNDFIMQTDSDNNIILTYLFRNCIQIYNADGKFVKEIKINGIGEEADLETSKKTYELLKKVSSEKFSRFYSTSWKNKIIKYCLVDNTNKDLLVQVGDKTEEFNGQIFILDYTGQIKGKFRVKNNERIAMIDNNRLYTIHKDGISFCCYELKY